jgi:hypothetical protein
VEKEIADVAAAIENVNAGGRCGIHIYLLQALREFGGGGRLQLDREEFV